MSSIYLLHIRQVSGEATVAMEIFSIHSQDEAGITSGESRASIYDQYWQSKTWVQKEVSWPTMDCAVS